MSNHTEKQWQDLLGYKVINSLCLFVIVTSLTGFYWKRRFLYYHSQKVPGPKAIFASILDVFYEFPNIAKVWCGPVLCYAISKPEYIEKILTSPNALSKMFVYAFMESSVGKGLICADVPSWKRHRKIISPTFNKKIIHSFIPTFNKYVKETTKTLEEHVNKSEFDVFDTIFECIMNSVCESIIGTKSKMFHSDIATWLKTASEVVFLRIMVMYYFFDFTFKWSQLYRDEQKALKNLGIIYEKIIKERRSIICCENTEENKFKSLLDQLLTVYDAHGPLTDKEIRDEVNTFLIAGTETTTTTLSFALLMLAIHEDIQQKVFEEVIEILGPDRDVVASDLTHLEYIERVIKETMRLFPTVPFIARSLTDDVVLEDGLVLPKGSSVVIGVMPLHRSSKLWQNPLEFNPDRFLPEENAKRHSHSYIPFSAGSRNCIGRQYGMVAMKIFIALMVRKFRFSTSYKRIEDVELKVDLSLKALNGHNLSVTLR